MLGHEEAMSREGIVVCHRFEMVSGEEADAAIDWLRAVRRAMANGAGVATVAPPAFGRPADVPLDALDCYPGAESPVIVAEEGDLARIDLLWGVDVSWKRGLVFNARIESALSGSGLWSEAIKDGRCIVPVRAFYETRNVEGVAAAGVGEAPAGQAPFGASDPAELTRGAVADVEQGVLGLEGDPGAPAPRRPRGRRPQYRFAPAGGAALLLAGLRLGDRFVLVTCEPDAVVGRVHNRMPLSLTAPEALAWLDGATDARALLARHAPVPLESQEALAPAKRPADADQLSLF